MYDVFPHIWKVILNWHPYHWSLFFQTDPSTNISFQKVKPTVNLKQSMLRCQSAKRTHCKTKKGFIRSTLKPKWGKSACTRNPEDYPTFHIVHLRTLNVAKRGIKSSVVNSGGSKHNRHLWGWMNPAYILPLLQLRNDKMALLALHILSGDDECSLSSFSVGWNTFMIRLSNLVSHQ